MRDIRKKAVDDLAHAVHDDLATHLLRATFKGREDRMLHGGVLQNFGRLYPLALDQTLSAGGHRRRGQ